MKVMIILVVVVITVAIIAPLIALGKRGKATAGAQRHIRNDSEQAIDDRLGGL